MSANIRRNLLCSIDANSGVAALNVDLVGPRTLPISIALGAAGYKNACRLVGSGGIPPYAYAIPGGGGALPTGLTLNGTTGDITGTPTAQGSFPFIIEITDSSSTVTPRSFQFDVSGNLYPLRGHDTPTTAVRLQPYAYQILVADSTGSTAGITYALSPGSAALPAGITITSGGLLTATSVTGAAGNYAFSVRATKSGATVDIAMAIGVNLAFSGGGAFTIDPALQSMTVGTPVDAFVRFTGTGVGLPPFIWSVPPGSLPAGLSMDTRGRHTGTPTTPTPNSFVQPTYAITDAMGQTRTYTPTAAFGGATLSVAPTLKSSLGTAGNRVLVTDAGGLPVAANLAALYFSSGQNGDAVLDGVASVAWASKSGSTYTATRDIFVHDLTIAAGVVLDLGGFALTGSGQLDLTSATAGAIVVRSKAGGPGTAAGGGQGGLTGFPHSLGIGAKGGDGAAGVVGSPLVGGTAAGIAISNGGQGFTAAANAGKGGTGTGGTPSARGQPSTIDAFVGYPFPFGALTSAAGTINGGAGGYGAGAGAGDGTTKGGSGGGGGEGGHVGMVSFYEVLTGPSTPAGVFKILPGAGGSGQNVASINIGAGGGAQGGAGGYWHIRYALRTGTPIASLVWADGATGGTAGVNSVNAARNGFAGEGGAGGNIEVVCVLTGAVTAVAQSFAPVAPVGTVGGTGGQTRAVL